MVYWLVPFSGLLNWLLPCSQELVVHSQEWTTGSHLFRAFVPVAAPSQGASGPLAHAFSGLLTQFLPFPRELVVHSTKWTTGSYLFLAFDLVSDLFRGASGPLSKVDHWLTPFQGFWPSFRTFTES